ncbi:tRNA U-34 5-methylaminomethyl-2-thiouridine biosynthesis protein MnmC [Vitreoscilla sp. C1]|uniref:FAD-dependent 5-carboxymethylaminomethyl-2-thiouridine(34) oxidoreductase MnmC n=1 Tax=Vitreoscilla sp. (strain C1) TaxID=96942 RepID=UPI000CDCA93E|nr:FAD-dependent 5-carboxymethylaminomethyl-2-thiouridine(34) oxidoreductase MnmC [Vitreoscilla sp. C1]AUZ04731.1 tRNA U-34 5-methylaminomethyl-2-thiouridine biosynthesis protein MnmC [Vitreoscilla sp. C1]
MSRPVIKTWLTPPPANPVKHVIIIGAGIAGASTAYALAKRGIEVTVLDAAEAASGASGNHQGLLYAKITAADTAQNQLLRLAFPFALSHLQHHFPDKAFWDDCGLFQWAFDDKEYQHQQKLLQSHYIAIENWQNCTAQRSSIWQEQQGLWWPQGAWVSPPLWVQALLQHPNIHVHTHQKVHHFDWQHPQWQVHTNNDCFQASHLIICSGNHSDVFTQTQCLNLRRIRGQVAYADSHAAIHIPHAITGQHYLTPAFQNRHTFGASFVFNDEDIQFRVAEHQHNLNGLQQLSPQLADVCATQQIQGRASIRADSIDHLPILGPLSDARAMQHTYAKLSQDKHYLIEAKCPYYPNLWINTAHGTRGMVTAPICAESLARRLCQETDILPQPLQDALHPNRLPIRQLIYGQSAF